ncbi:glycosyltransferase family 4 protein [Paenibacillus sp. 32O-W]|uniref:glycosyltransferase family 4 protein n=1 Tax=Paenibacillus sp. 32O-W TaxID=1695218 RepID=UPI0011A80EFF|nr:glycosyltransferase family 4 protein [Paenibacillus sp. 32O-W]
MKILYIYKYCILGGVTTQLVNRLNYLSQMCTPYFVFLSDHGGRSAFNGYPHIYILDNKQKMINFLNQNKFDLIVTIDTYEIYEVIDELKINVTVIHEVHSTYITTLMKLKEVLAKSEIAAIITPSEYLKNKIIMNYSEKSNIPIYCVENCLDTSLFSYKDVIYESLNNERMLLWVGKLDDHKNWKFFIEVAVDLKAHLKGDVIFQLVGGHTAPDSIKNEFIRTISKYKIDGFFNWIPFVDYKNMPEIYSKVAKSGGLCISTSIDESFGMSLIEAISCNCPVIAPKVGAIPEILDGNLSQYLYEVNNKEDCINKIIRRLEIISMDEDYITKYGNSFIFSNYNIPKIGNKYLEVILKTVTG